MLKFSKKLVIILFSFPFFLFSSQKNVFITEIKNSGKNIYSVTFNDEIVLNQIQVIEDGQDKKKKLILPKYIKNGREYVQIRIVDKDLEKKVINHLTKGITDSITQKTDCDYEITKFELNKKKDAKVKAFAKIVFMKAIEVNCGIMGDDKSWILWPSSYDKTQKRWQKYIFFKTKEFKKLIENDLLNKYETILLEGIK